MPVEYFKRQRMRRDAEPSGPVELPPKFEWLPWRDDLADVHAAVLFQSFASETDSELFPSLSSETGCRMLVRAIRDSFGFCPAATWLIRGPNGPVGSVQGLLEFGEGSIQNVAVLPELRGRGLGEALVRKALVGFAAQGALGVELEVTVANGSAVSLYRRLGFQAYKASYRSVERPDRAMVGLGI